uniref:Aminodeoxychorismate lyase n=1 Tax=Candidatus Aschnera chinzeii TaxID=1485666 RepID=A0AAT9G3T1_9ENTR|nr:MAG: aminodeoxychorismate lyase [Candidatus Aschnera chinzeii]
MICLINGKIKNTISITDRGLHYGDGCFTTIRVIKDKVELFEYHISRLKKCAKKLFLPSINWKNISDDINTLALLNKEKFAVIKVIITRGSGYNRGYSTIGFNKPTVIMFLNHYPIKYIDQQKNGIKLIISKIPITNNYYLSEIKHLNCLEHILIKKQIEIMEVDEAITTDINNNILGCCSSNIFWRKGQYIYTPDLSQGGVKGIMRKKIIHCLLKSMFKFYFIKAKINMIELADEIIISNALMPILYVNTIIMQKKIIDYVHKDKILFHYLKSYCL